MNPKTLELARSALAVALSMTALGPAVGCARTAPGRGRAAVPTASTSPPVSSASPSASASAGNDPLGPAPLAEGLPAFRPGAPAASDGPSGSKLWVFERHDLPLVDVAVVEPFGSAVDPARSPGLAYAVARMLTEGAGGRDAIGFAQAVRDLGASLTVNVDRDYSVASMRVLKDRMADAVGLLADALLRPRITSGDFSRVRDLWHNALVARSEDPAEISRVLAPVLFFGPDHPYGHPPEGTVASSRKVTLDEVRRWQPIVWRPETATFLAVGDVTEGELGPVLRSAFAGWRGKGKVPTAEVAEPPPRRSPVTVVVDRASAPQVVLSIAEKGVAAGHSDLPRLEMMNFALGGSFGSRLNHSLREVHGWTYGASSGFRAQRSSGALLVRAAIRTDALADALAETLRLMGTFGEAELSQDEWARVRAQAQGEMVMTYGNLASIEGSLADFAALGLPPDQNQRILASQLSATPADVLALARTYVRRAPSVVLLVGPIDPARQALAHAGLPEPELRDGEGNPVRVERAPAEGPAPAPSSR